MCPRYKRNYPEKIRFLAFNDGPVEFFYQNRGVDETFEAFFRRFCSSAIRHYEVLKISEYFFEINHELKKFSLQKIGEKPIQT